MNESEVVNSAIDVCPVVRQREIVAWCLRGIQTSRRDSLGVITFIARWGD